MVVLGMRVVFVVPVVSFVHISVGLGSAACL